MHSLMIGDTVRTRQSLIAPKDKLYIFLAVSVISISGKRLLNFVNFHETLLITFTRQAENKK